MSNMWDQRNQAVVHEWNSISSMLINPADEILPERHIIHANKAAGELFDIDSLYVSGNSDTLIVALHGALVRNQVELPRFEWFSALKNRDEHKLFIGDTMLSNSDKLTLGWYIGNEADDLTIRIADFIKHVMTQRNLKKVLLLGSSGGGYAALAIATYIENSTVLAFTPQTDVWQFSVGHTKNLLEEIFPNIEHQEKLVSDQPERYSLIERYKRQNTRNRFIYIQNTGDVEHFRTHFKPFAESLGVRLPNGRTFDQRGRFISFFHGTGT